MKFNVLTGRIDGREWLLNNKYILYLVGHGSLTPFVLSGDPFP